MLFFFQAEDGIRDLVRSRGLGDVYKRQGDDRAVGGQGRGNRRVVVPMVDGGALGAGTRPGACLFYTSDAADERSRVDLGGGRII